MDAAGQDVDREQRRAVVRISLGVGLATGAVRRLVRGGCGHLRLLGAADLRAVALVFIGASQFALVGVVAWGGSPMVGAASALLLGSRHTLYGLRLATTLQLAGWRRLAGAHLVIDESTAMAVAQPRDQQARVGFFAAGGSVFVLWNAATLAGALGGTALGDPRTYGLDAAVGAAFLALLWPRRAGGWERATAVVAVAVAVGLVPVTTPGVPVLAAGAVALLLG